jgi:hypothetical protein
MAQAVFTQGVVGLERSAAPSTTPTEGMHGAPPVCSTSKEVGEDPTTPRA